MQRDLKAMSEAEYDLVIVGGGITGASVAWDASLRGLKVALLEKGDFAHGTTSGSSKLTHGGLRYLVNGELKLVRESLRERRIWEQVAPHMVHPLPFVIPTYGWGMKGPFVLSIGLTFYDLLSYDRNWLSDTDKKLPGFRSISRGETLDLIPSLPRDGLTGGKIYYDCQMFAPERLCLSVLMGAVEYGAKAANYAEVTRFVTEASAGGNAKRISGVEVTDRLTGETHMIKGRVVVNGGGPWADKMIGMAEEHKPSRRLMRSKGIHIITRDISGKYAFAIQSDIGGHFFVIPWRGHTIIGTTDKLYEGDPDKVGVSEDDIEDFIRVVNNGLPGLELTRDDVIHFYAGLRPLIDDSEEGEERNSYTASREAEVCDHAKLDGIDGLISALGGKWTTSRALAEEVVDMALAKLGREAKCETEATPVHGGEIGRLKSFIERAKRAHPDMSEEAIENLVMYYGGEYERVLDMAEGDNADANLKRRLGLNLPDIGAQVIHAVRNEMAQTLSDVIFRRTGLGTLGTPGTDVVKRVAELMARELDWDETRLANEMAETLKRFETVSPESQKASA